MQINTIIQGDTLTELKKLPAECIDMIVTSPPYYGLRDYGTGKWIGGQPDCDHQMPRKKTGTLWLNLGDTYSTQCKNLVGIPWRVAFALQATEWILRQDIIWSKPNPMPESVKDRCTKSHEYVFLFSKNQNYYFDNEAIKEDAKHPKSIHVHKDGNKMSDVSNDPFFATKPQRTMGGYIKRNRRSVWIITTKPFKEAHFATFPEDLIAPMILAGCPKEGIVLDPFMGAGTTAVVAKKLKRNWLGIELNSKYVEMANQRIKSTPSPLL